MSKKQITIIIPLFNRASLILETLQSIKAQSSKDWKCIVVDDGSTDKSCQVVNELAENDTRIKLIKRDRGPKGANTCRNIGLDLVSTEWVMFFDSDDIMLPNCLSERIKSLEENNENELLFSQGLTFSSHGIMNFRNNPMSKDYVKDIVSFNVALSTPAAVWNTSFIKKIRGWNENLQRWQDCELFIRAMQLGVKYKWISLTPDHLIRSQGNDNRITNSKSKYKDLEGLISIFSEVYLTLSKSNKLIFSKSIFYYCLKSSYFISAQQNKAVLGIIKKNNILTPLKFIKFKLYMTLNVKFKKVKYLKGIMHLFITSEIKNYHYNEFYVNEELLELSKTNIEIQKYIR